MILRPQPREDRLRDLMRAAKIAARKAQTMAAAKAL